MISERYVQALSIAALAVLTTLLSGCAFSSHPTAPSELGKTSTDDALVASLERPGTVEFTKVVAATWQVDRSGLINLDHPTAREAGIVSGMEPIEIYFYAIDHPEHGTFIVDSGMTGAFGQEERDPYLSAIVRAAMDVSTMDVKTTTSGWLADTGREAAGVFLTHLHLDHIMGVPEFTEDVPVYTGPGETTGRAFLNAFTRGTIDRLLASAGPLLEWQFDANTGGRFAGVIDIFGDESVWAIHVPGHTPGSTAFLVRAKDGNHLITGDASHTAWGWENDVEPGTFSFDGPRSVISLASLRDLSRTHPDIEVHLGHQDLDGHGGPLAFLLH